MLYSSPKQLSFPPIAGHTLRADFEVGALSSDFGPLLLRGIDRQIGLTTRLAAAVQEKRHPSYIDHPLRDLFAQRIYQLASGYADGNDGSCTLILRIIPAASKTRYNAPISHRFEGGALPWCRIFFSTSSH